MRNEDKNFKVFNSNRYTKLSNVSSLRHPIDKVGSITSFSSENTFCSVTIMEKIF